MSFKISDICNINSSNLSAKDSYEFINYLDTSNLTEGVVDSLQKLVIGEDKIPSRAKRKVKKNDILISTVRPNQKHYGILKKLKENTIVSTGFAVLTAKEDMVDAEYLYRYLTQDSITNYLQAVGETSTSTYPSIKPSDIGSLEIELPELEDQKAIAKILSDLDEKIETNNKINKKLEEMAQAIFKQWFVDFEFPNEDGKPYKSSGGEMVESELGMIPSGWKVELLKSYCDVKKGLSYKGKHLVEDGTPMINLGNVNPGGGFRRDKCKFYDGDFKEQHTVKAGDIIIANTDMTQERVILGSPIFVPDFKTESIIFTHHLFAFRNLKIPKSFLYYYLKSKSFRERAESYATGTTVLAISRDSVLNINFVKANNEVLNNFDLITKSILDRIENNNLEIEKLQKLRDELLPKLMSGEIRINNVNI